jgi:hypothetical protein
MSGTWNIWFKVLIILTRQEFLYIRIIINLAYIIQVLNLEQGLKERLLPNPNIKIKIVTLMIARELFVFKPLTNTEGGQKSAHTKQRHTGNYAHWVFDYVA